MRYYARKQNKMSKSLEEIRAKLMSSTEEMSTEDLIDKIRSQQAEQEFSPVIFQQVSTL